MNLFGSARWLIDKTKNGENVPSLEVVEVDNQYQKKSEVLYAVTPNKSFGYLSNVEPINFICQMLNQINFQYSVWWHCRNIYRSKWF